MVAILGANSVSGGYEVSNSLRFNDGDSPSLNRTPSGSGTTGTWTWSGWVKRGVSSTDSFVMFSSGAVNARGHIYFNSDNIIVQPFNSSGASMGRKTEAVFRDHSAWYHIVVIANSISTSNLSTNLDIYVNGIEVSTIATGSGTPSGGDRINDGQVKMIGQFAPSSGSHFDGYMSEINFIDGTAKAHTDFGEFDDNGVWIPIKYTGTYGTNGFFLEFKQTGTSQNSSGIGADTSGNDNHFAVTNLAATDITEDTCTNNFCTWNPLNTAVGGFYTNTLLQGNLQCSSGGFGATFDMPSGKWYWEVRCNSSDADQAVGAMSVTESGQTSLAGDSNPTHGFIYQANGNARRNGTVEETWSTFTNGDIIGFSYDADNRILKGYKNNSLAGDITLTDSGDSYTPTVTALGGNFIANFGQEGSFAGTVTAQGNSDGKYGNFYYAPPSGYYALCTKRLAEFG